MRVMFHKHPFVVTDILEGFVTGGKIDHNKPETLNLMRAMADMPKNVKLLVFGSVVPSLKEEFDKLLEIEVNDEIQR